MSTFAEEFAKFRTPKQIVRDALTSELLSRLCECTTAQQENFTRAYPTPFEKIKDVDLPSAVDLVHRTLAKNRTTETET